MEFHVTIDFNDDIWFGQGRWDEGLLRKLIRTYAAAGISAIHWIDNGPASDGMYDAGTWMDDLASTSDFFQRVPNPLAIVADEAHKLGLKAYSVLKVFDFGFGVPWSSRTPQEAAASGLLHVGGVGNELHWLTQHGQFRSRLHPALRETGPRRPIGTIRLWHEGAELAPTEFRLLVSHDNRNYRPVTGELCVTRSVRRRKPPIFVPAPQQNCGPEGDFACIEFTGLKIDEPFIGIEPLGPTQLANTLAAMVEVEDIDGQTAVFTPGLIALQRHGRTNDWRTHGIAFDAAFGTDVNGRGWRPERSGGNVRVPLAKYGFLGVGRGRNDHLAGMLEPIYPEVRNWWTQLALRAIRDGCDGADIRLTTHTESLDWENYGFNEPLIAEFGRRYDVDIARQNFDRAAWRRLRGEYFTAFLEQASRAVRSAGGQFLAHLYDHCDAPLEEDALHEMHFDWRVWLDRGWLDGATFNSFAFNRPFYADALGRCRQGGVGTIMTAPLHSADDETWRTYGNELIDHAFSDGLAAFNIYESANVARLEGQDIRLLRPALWDRIARERHAGQ